MRNTSEAPVANPDAAPGESDGGRQRVSVVIPCYNAETWVARTIQSVLDQPGVEPEVIVIDDGSTDGSLEVIRGFGERIHWETGPNRGACAARNWGLELATADYVMFLDADDYLEGAYLSGGLKSLISSGADLALGTVELDFNGERRTYAPPAFEDALDAIVTITKHPGMPTTGIMWHKDTMHQICGWWDGLRGHQDVEVLLRAYDSGAKGVTWGEGHLVYFQHETPGRISRKIDAGTVQDRIKVILAMRAILLRRGIDEAEANELLHTRVNELLRRCARRGTSDAYRAAYELWLHCGAPRLLGTRAHVFASRLLGLRQKERLSLFLVANFRRGHRIFEIK